MVERYFDVIVVGGGHAGVEAAAASARMGASTALLTQNIATIGSMSCNPAFGGLGKGHLIREIDALDGVMGECADRAGIHYRLLNRRKGPAVQGPRVQADRVLYRAAIQQKLRQLTKLSFIQGECVDFKCKHESIYAIYLSDGEMVRCRSLVIATGTFLGGVIFLGADRISAGRIGEAPSLALSSALGKFGLTLGRLKTGTPPRLDGRSIDFAKLEPQWGDSKPQYLSSLTNKLYNPQTLCHITRTTAASHKLIKDNLDKTAIYSGATSAKGPRYCPSIEDKVVRFPERPSHQIFLEPEGREDFSVYPNGISTSLPVDLQKDLIRTIPGLQRAKIIQPAYAIEYAYIDPRGLSPSLMVPHIGGLFMAGQINGTTGYEEAGAQGVVAGINAALVARGKLPIEFDRTNSYIGVLIDDLTTFGVSEPYRIFTSRAEFRLSLRSDNADERLTPLGIELGVVGEARKLSFRNLLLDLTRARDAMTSFTAVKSDLPARMQSIAGAGRRSVFDWASCPGIDLAELASVCPPLASTDASIVSRLDADAKYSVYLERQRRDIEMQRRDAALEIPADLNFNEIPGLSSELRIKFTAQRPKTVAQASRCEGVTPAALLLLAARAKSARLPPQ